MKGDLQKHEVCTFSLPLQIELARGAELTERVDERVDALLEHVTALDEEIVTLRKAVRELGTPISTGDGWLRSLYSPDESIDIGISDDGNAIHMALARVEVGGARLLPGEHCEDESDEDRRDYRVGWWALASVSLGFSAATIIFAFLWWIK